MPETASPTTDSQTLAELAPTGVLRVALNLGNPVLVQKDPASGRLGGVTIDMARDVADKLGLAVEFKEFDSAGIVSECALQNVWDLAFLAIDPKRAAGILYTEPYVHIEGTYMVPESSPIRSLEEVDRPGVRVAVGEGTAYDLFLTRHLGQAEIVRFETSDESLLGFAGRGIETAAGIRQALELFTRDHGGYRILDGYFAVIEQAVGCPRGRPRAAAFLQQYLDHAKRSGLIAMGLERSGQPPLFIPPPKAAAL